MEMLNIAHLGPIYTEILKMFKVQSHVSPATAESRPALHLQSRISITQQHQKISKKVICVGRQHISTADRKHSVMMRNLYTSKTLTI